MTGPVTSPKPPTSDLIPESARRPEPTAAYPRAQRGDVVDVLHGREVADPYRWLEHPDHEQTATWSAAQDALYAEHGQGWSGREHLARRVRELLAAGVVGVPAWRGQRHFLTRRTAEQEHAVLVVVDGADERVLVDPMVLDPSGTTTLDAWQPSKEGQLLAYQVSEGGSEESVLRVIDVATGELVDGPVDRARYSPVAWLPGSEAFYYVRRLDPAGLPQDEQQYHRRVWLHRVGTDPDQDVMVFGEGLDLTNYYGVQVSMDGRWLVVSAAAGTAPRNDVWIADLHASAPDSPQLREVVVGQDAQTGVHVGRDGRLYVFTDLNTPRGRIAVASPEQPSPEHWQDLVGQDDEAVLEDFALLDGPELGDVPVLLAAWTRHAVSEVSVHELPTGVRRDGAAGRVELPGLGTIGGLAERPEGGHECWFAYTDHTTPPHVYRYDARDASLSVWATPPGVVDVPDVVTRLVSTTSADGTTVRAFVTARADFLDQAGMPRTPAPTILYGYGGFAISLTPAYSAATLAWVEAGGVYAVANLRGGGEEGESWHRDGMRAVKQHTFDDCHAVAQELVDQGWTTSHQLAVSGGSNGGLLVGAVLTQRPELYAAVLCAAPLLDMVRYQRHGLGVTWSEEYGDAGDAEQLGWLLSYSPYHHVREGVDYPAVLFTVFDGDSRVDPLHARKMCAALQHATRPGVSTRVARPILIRREADVGHGARALSRTVELLGDTLAFAAEHTGLHLP